MKVKKSMLPVGVLIMMAFALSGCTPTVRVEAPSEPIQINMNVRIQQEVRVRVEKDLEEEFVTNPELFGIPSASK